MANIDFEQGTDSTNLDKNDPGIGADTGTLGGGTITYSTTAAAHGTLGMLVTKTADNTAVYWQWDLGDTDTRGTFRWYFNTSGRFLIPIVRVSIGSKTVEFRLDTDGTMYIAVGGSRKATSAVFYNSGSEYRGALTIDTIADTATVNVYSGDDTDPINSSPVSATSLGLSGGTLSNIRVGVVSGGSNGDWIGYDDLDWALGTTTEIGPAVTLPAAADVATIASVTANTGSWAATGAADIPSAVAVDLTDPDNPVVDTGSYIASDSGDIDLRNNPLTEPPRHLYVSAACTIAPATITIKALQGSTVRATTEATALTTSPVKYTLTLTDPERSAVTTEGDGSVDDLDIRVTAG